MLRIDLDRREIVASVRDLAFPSGDLPRAAGALGSLRAELGTSVHRRVRAARERDVAGYRAERSLAWQHRVDDFTVRLSGRLDGLVEEGGTLLAEEVKSVLRPEVEVADLTAGDMPRAALQVRLYALMLARSRPGARVVARLLVVSILDGTERTLGVPFDADRTERELDDLLRRHLAAARRRATRAVGRAGRAAVLRFPYDAHRPHQQELIETIEQGLAEGRPVLAEAPTGIGKTVAALLPALRYALRRDALVFYLTAKRTQRAHVAATAESLAEASGLASGLASGSIRVTTLRPRTSMCPTGRLVCHVDHCPLLANVHRAEPRESVLAGLLDGVVHVTPDAVYAAGERNDLCPHVLSSMIAARVDLVIGDYNHVYSPAAVPGAFVGESTPRAVVAVIDEAHNLYDRAREYDSVFLPRDAVVSLARRYPSRDPCEAPLFAGLDEPAPLHGFGSFAAGGDVFDDLARLFADLLALVDRTIRESVEEEPASSADGCCPAQPGAPAWESLGDRAALLAVRYLARRSPLAGPPSDDPVVATLGHVIRMRDLLRRKDESLAPYARCGTASEQEANANASASAKAGVGFFCLDPAPRLRERHRTVLRTIAMSATLSPIGHFRKGLGFEHAYPVAITLPSPFPAENRRVLVVPSVTTTWRERSSNYGRIARVVEQVVASRPGHYAVYFPSFRFLEAVRARLDVAPATLVVQRSRMPDRDRRAVLDRLRRDPGPVLLLAVSGGVLAEGIDLPGDALIGVIVVGPALPPVGFERDAMRRYHDNRDEDGFARAMLYPGMQRVIQAAGRVHRTAADRGVIVLLGRRFSRPPYADCLPASWSRWGVEELVARDPRQALEDFWDPPAPAG